MHVTSGTVVATVSGIVRTTVVSPDRSDHTSARRAAKQLALAQRVSAVYVWGCTRCNRIQDSGNPVECCGVVRPLLAVARPERRHLLAHPAPPPGGQAPAWLNDARPAPAGLLAPTPDDVASLAMRRLWERLESGVCSVSPADVAALVRLAREAGRADLRSAPGHSDEAWQASVRQLLWLAKSHLGTNWPAFVRDVRADRHLLDLWGDPPGPGS
jgi:hypothetical protein